MSAFPSLSPWPVFPPDGTFVPEENRPFVPSRGLTIFPLQTAPGGVRTRPFSSISS